MSEVSEPILYRNKDENTGSLSSLVQISGAATWTLEKVNVNSLIHNLVSDRFGPTVNIGVYTGHVKK